MTRAGRQAIGDSRDEDRSVASKFVTSLLITEPDAAGSGRGTRYSRLAPVSSTYAPLGVILWLSSRWNFP